MSQRVTAAEGAALLGVPASVIASWKHSKRVIPVAVIRSVGSGRPSPLYELEELRPLAAEYRARAATRRKNEA